MMKKLIAILIIGVIGAVALAGTKAGSYIRSQLFTAQEDIENSIEPNTEIRRIRFEIGQLDKDVDIVKGELAEANVNVRLLSREVEDLRKDVDLSEKSARVHGEAVKSASENDKLLWGNRQVGYAEAKDLLFAEVKRHNDLKARLHSKENALVSQSQTRDRIDQQFHAMMDQKDELTNNVMDLESEVRLAQVEQVNSKYQDDGTRMAKIKKSMADLRKRMLIQREKLSLNKTAEKSPAASRTVDEILSGLNNPGPAKGGVEEVKVIAKP
jgi:phage shock protein A